MHNGADNRLTDVFIMQAMKPALDTVERHWRENWRAGQARKDESLCKGALILVGNRKQDKFFSNGTCYVAAPWLPTHELAVPEYTCRSRLGGCDEGSFVQDELLSGYARCNFVPCVT